MSTLTDRPTVMLVDDDVDLLALMKVILEKEGFAVEARTEPPDWSDLRRTDPVVMFMDMGLGTADGAEVCSILKRHPQSAALPIILISGQERSQLQERAIASKADGYLSKPFNKRLLIDLAQHYARRS
jgi:CheY-like chemotaxis protein